METPEWTYHRGMPNRRGLRKFTHLIRSPYDPDETMARGKANRDPTHWQKTADAVTWSRRIARLMRDARPRTFNAICVELTGTNGDVWHTKPQDLALWSLVRQGRLAWACEEGAVFFCDSSFVNWRTHG